MFCNKESKMYMYVYLIIVRSSMFKNDFFFPLGSAAFRAFHDPHFQCEAGWRSCDHRAFKCTVQDYKEVSGES